MSSLPSGPPVVRNRLPFSNRSQICGSARCERWRRGRRERGGGETHQDADVPDVRGVVPGDVEDDLGRAVRVRLDVAERVVRPEARGAEVAEHGPAVVVDARDERARGVDGATAGGLARARGRALVLLEVRAVGGGGARVEAEQDVLFLDV